jgi:hypothetical protein
MGNNQAIPETHPAVRMGLVNNQAPPVRDVRFDAKTTDEDELMKTKKELKFEKERADFWFRAHRAARMAHEATLAKLTVELEKKKKMEELYEATLALEAATKKRKTEQKPPQTRSQKKGRI